MYLNDKLVQETLGESDDNIGLTFSQWHFCVCLKWPQKVFVKLLEKTECSEHQTLTVSLRRNFG